MMDEREDRLDALLRDAAQQYNAPPATPKAEIWERIAAVRRYGGAAARQEGSGVLPLRRSARLPFWIGIAALLALGVAIGRLSVPRNAAIPTPAPTLSATPGTAPEGTERAQVAAQLVTAQHLGQVETFLTEFDTRQAAQDFPAQAKDLLSTTRLLLDSKRLTDAGTRKLLEDLELVLIQIATLNPKDRSEELDFIADGLAQSHLRSRLRNAIPAAPAIRM
ncbi:MAG TPA: hypothetical protein VGQ69_02560 [Gemmatimonadales bacterium]|jgi:hypothetical protein|nr:hypothetical protein [Gemmatimonadales bacterium]